MKISFVVAMGMNREIGKDGAMPWHMPADLAHFKRVTMGKPMVMGRKTFESIGRPLPGRDSIVVTRDAHWHAAGVIVAHDLDSALHEAERAARRRGVDEVAVIGGGVLFEALLDRADIIHLTELQASFEADTWFPELDRSQWIEVSRETRPADEANPIACDFVLLRRA
ncbi:MAG TPA: dihydrofolate reductase [Gammaproteobacteria bacterium]|nr:dihydrofolate reductase [Gammaproteobacteria bacterium]